ncbi:twin-arginine translocation pathway signal protein [Mycolicibacterium chubuense]|uniref:B12 binding domain protein n=1 Tax=Mycolicibacterium chubuense TaxID=1800 RepID=A0A0J6VS19_MYCCU|nr:cobalamin-dependent protein [Mycolicibacterium chubuense]KMO73830.1 B12 binding domain protein [Mycolicibacterium chubuense]ORA54938.1 twin-arginine translocation pathway signal protein [Mycolicibacterium chubuense]SPX97632.1 putative cobalamin binding protein [Mycolicibacterium chubuense]
MRKLADGDRVQDYVRAVASRDTKAVQSLMTRLLDDGMDPVTVLTDVIAAVQRDNGERWQRGEWTVAEEHAATAMAVAATKAVSRHVRRAAPTRGRVLVACAEREWHALPAMIIDCTLRSDGWNTVLMGAATSPARLNQYLQDYGPEAVAVSCSMLGSLSATRRFIEASTAAGVPILVGGPAFGVDDVRAKALGATAWAADAQGALAAVADLPAVVPPAMPLPADAVAEQANLEHDHRLIVEGLAAGWSVTARALPDRADAEVAIDALNQLLHAVSAVLLTGDSRPVPETTAWIAEVVTTRGFDVAVVAELAEKASAALQGYPLARGIVDTHFADAL